jgi:hypothetical protein
MERLKAEIDPCSNAEVAAGAKARLGAGKRGEGGEQAVDRGGTSGLRVSERRGERIRDEKDTETYGPGQGDSFK